jgi:hypothetical protein
VTRPASLLAWRSLSDRPWRSAVLLLGYGVGVAVMIALLSVGDALLTEARDPDLASGGDVVLLPEGADPAVLKVGGVTGLYLTIPQASFLVDNVLAGPRFGRDVIAAAPEVRDRLAYIRVRGSVLPALASAGIPSLDLAANAAPAVPGARDGASDRAWVHPTPDALINRIDRFHRAPPAAQRTWAEWDYFNMIDPRTGAYGYLTFLAGADGNGAILLRLRRPGVAVDDVTIPVRLGPDDLSQVSANQRFGPGRIAVEPGGYHVLIDDARVQADLHLTPEPGFFLPPGETRDGAFISGYVVPALRGWITGTMHTGRTSLRLAHAPAYHDHNWGTWRDVSWEWGEASSPAGGVLYGALHVAGDTAMESAGRPPVMFLWGSAGAHRSGLIGMFPIASIEYRGWRPGPMLANHRVSAPARIVLIAGAGKDTLRMVVTVRDALAGRPLASGRSGRRAAAPTVFLQLRGTASVRGTIDGSAIVWSGPGAFETFARDTP